MDGETAGCVASSDLKTTVLCYSPLDKCSYLNPWVNVQNFQNPELSILKLAVCPLNIYNFRIKRSIVLRQSENKSENLIQHFEDGFLWKVILKILNSETILKTFTDVNNLYFLKFSTKSYFVGTQMNRLNEMILLSTQNQYLNGRIRK